MISVSKRSTLSLALVILLLVPQPTRPVYAVQSNTHTGEYLTYALTAAAIFSGLFVAYKVADWLFTETDEQVLQRAQDDLQGALASYKDMTIFSVYENVSEEILATMADQLGGGSISHYFMRLNGRIHELELHINELDSRADKLSVPTSDKFQNKKNAEIANKMRRLSQEINQQKAPLENLHTIMCDNERYFKLYKKHREITQQYKTVFDLYNSTSNADKEFNKTVKAVVITCMGDGLANFVCMFKANRVKYDYERLEKAINKCPQYTLTEEAKKLVTILKHVEQILINSTDYKKEKNKKREANDREYQLQESKRQTAAQEQLAQEAQRKNDLKEKELQQKEEEKSDEVNQKNSYEESVECRTQ